MPYKVENIVKKGEIACYNVFLCYIYLVHQNAVLFYDGLTPFPNDKF